ncbi:kinase [Rhodophyticola sp. CCM32]|uniref:PfkB family carbohydrate kinase n=1 Tax=Rhodophyticola sp. CCM32 TaxID=2916397 RepID=UPI00107F8369|nr:PfkB family carbohydrate kinase [Rhodophyticola sp. CCM32]QBY00297.1 kinase [Rhodophyticola sp. CCM32]
MNATPDILCIGSVLWDVIGRCAQPMVAGNDRPGRITRLPGGVALNIATTLRQFDLTPALISVVGRDAEGNALLAACGQQGLVMQYVLIDPDLPTDQYMAIEARGELIAAIADAHSLEAADARILQPLEDGRLGSAARPWAGLIAIDGNLTQRLLADIAANPLFAAADLRIAPASPGKAERLRPMMGHRRATLYVNCEEAGLLTGTVPESAEAGAHAMLATGARRVLVTDGAGPAAFGLDGQVLVCAPPMVEARRITGAGDTFMAAHIAAEAKAVPPEDALHQAVKAAAEYVTGSIGL